LGHGSPLTAVGHYLAAVEWLPYLLDDHEEGFDVPLDAAARLLGLKGPRRLQQIARRDASRVRGRIDADHVIALLVARLARLLRRG
jgi:hypothetical protein